MGARLAQECVRITAGDFRSMIFPTQYRVPSYARWLLREADLATAEQLLFRSEPAGPEWRCHCGEQLGAQFSQCWRCGAYRPL